MIGQWNLASREPDWASRLRANNPRRICIIKPSALGDIVQSLPLLPVLRERFSGVRVSWVIARSFAPLLEGHPDLDEIICFDRGGSFSKWRRLLTHLRQAKFDVVFDLQGLLRTGIMTWATRAPLRVGLEAAREGAHWACHFEIPGTGLSVPAHLRYGRIAEGLGMSAPLIEPRIAIARADHDWAHSQLQSLEGRILAIHPGAGWTTKRWPAERFAAVASKAARRFGFHPIILGSDSERETATQVEHTLRSLIPSVTPLNLAGQTTLKQLAAVLEQSMVLLTNDSGPMHLAAALGTPVVGVFTCTSALRSGPAGSIHQTVSSEVSCAASYRKRCPYQGRKHLACMEELDVDRVWAALCRLMQQQFPKIEAA
jgi:lipopolysaccharide heptosyltransferase II